MFSSRAHYVSPGSRRVRERSGGLEAAAVLARQPWLFTFTRDGRVAARLEGFFGDGAFRRGRSLALGR
jgi:hypothetical protein